MGALLEAREKVNTLAKRLHDVFEEAGPDRDFRNVKSLEGDVMGKVEKVRQMNAELEEAHNQLKVLEEVEGIAAKVQADWAAQNTPANPVQHPKDGDRRPGQIKSIGRLLVESKEYQQFKGMQRWPTAAKLDVDIRNAVFRTGAGWDPETIRINRVELNPQRPIAVIDNIPMLPTGQDAVQYMEETTFTNNAVETAESTATTASDLIGEAALALTERTKPVEWIPVFLPVTIQQMEDVEGIEEYVNSRLTYMVRARLDSQALNGDGNTPNLEGTLNVSNIQSQALGGDPVPDAIYKCFTSIRSDGFAEPSVLFAHPNDWQGVRLLRTADGIYIWGPPTEAGPDRIWGVPVVQTTAATENTMVTGDYANFAALYTKRGITIEVSNSHANYFTRGMLAIRADMRVAMVHFRPKAFGEITGV